MLQELKEKSTKHTRGAVIVCVIISVALLVGAWFAGFNVLVKGKAYLNEMKDEEFGKEKQYVEADIYAIMDYYAYTTEDGKTTEKEYIIPVGEESYIGLVVKKSNLDQCDKIVQQTLDYMNGESEEISNVLHVKGTILPMSEDSLKYYKQYYEAIGWSEEELKAFLPYYLKVDYIGSCHCSGIYMLCIFAAIPVLIAVWKLLKNARGGYYKMVTQYCKKAPDYDRAMAELERFYQATAPVYGFRIARDFIMAPNGADTILIESKELLWAYKITTTHRTNGIKTGTSYSVMLKLRNGKNYNLGLSEQQVEDILEIIGQRLPFVFIGFDRELERAYNNKNSRQELIAAADRRIAEMNMAENDMLQMNMPEMNI
ncbi:MAG: hypothetical protein NC412_07540 [Roseburia sp.]|nr:hypothetical protein [Roseburia sp.]MCM1279426.1 hypothetical protein [Robinsoniella sp.]